MAVSLFLKVSRWTEFGRGFNIGLNLDQSGISPRPNSGFSSTKLSDQLVQKCGTCHILCKSQIVNSK